MEQAERHPEDPVDQSVWRPLRLMLAANDAEIARLYAEADIQGIRPGQTMVLIRLNSRGPMTITELAESVDVTHSAMSQKVAALRMTGFVRSVPGRDARTRRVALTAKARTVLPFLEAEWRATEGAVLQVEAEIRYPLSRVVTDIEQALRRKSFHDRITDLMAQDGSWQ